MPLPSIINGLVLAGGKSQRMGVDKTTLAWHGQEQRYHIAHLLKPLCNEVFISVSATATNTNDQGYPFLVDAATIMGPYGALLSAFQQNPHVAWLVVAADLPLLQPTTLHYLVSQRNLSAIATTFESPHDGLPEPLITIWESTSYNTLLACAKENYTCLRKVLMNTHQVHIIQPADANDLMNVNTPADLAKAKAILLQRKQYAYAK